MYLVIELSNNKIKVTCVNEKTRGVKGYVAREIPDGVVQNGYIINPESLEANLSAIVSSLPKAKGVVFLLNSTEIFQKDLTAPAIAPAKVRPIINTQMVSQIGTGKEYSIDFIIKDTFQEGEQQLYNIVAYAVPVNMVQSYIALASRLKLKLISVDVPHSAVNKALAGAMINNAPIPASSLLVKLGYRHIDMFLIENGVCTYTRKVDFETEEYLKMIHQIDPNAGFETISVNPAYREQFAAVQDLLEPMQNAIVDEIYRIQQYVYSRSQSKPITDIFVYGPISAINGMFEFLNSNLEGNIQPVTGISTLMVEQGIYPSDVLIPMGAADTSGINLGKSIAGPTGESSGDISSVLKLHIPITALLVIVVLVLTFVFVGNANKLQKDIDAINAEINSEEYRQRLATADRVTASLTDYKDNKQFIEDYITYFKDNNVITKDNMYDILLNAPTDITFAQLDYAGGELLITGLADKETSPAEYVQKLRDLKCVYYTGYSGTQLEEDTEGSTDEKYSFTILVGLIEQAPQTTETTTVATTAEATTTEGE